LRLSAALGSHTGAAIATLAQSCGRVSGRLMAHLHWPTFERPIAPKEGSGSLRRRETSRQGEANLRAATVKARRPPGEWAAARSAPGLPFDVIFTFGQ
jgi:hypothetical protein